MKTIQQLINQNKLLERALLFSIYQHLGIENPAICDNPAVHAEIDKLLDLAIASFKQESKEEK